MIAFYLLFLLVGLASAQSPEKAGDIFPIQFRSNGISDVQATDTPLGRSYILTHPGATYIALHFSKLALMKGDTIEVSDADGGQAYTLTGSGKGQGSIFWSQHIKGDTIVLNMITPGGDRSSFFEINEYAAGFRSFFEAICFEDNKVNAVCYNSSFATEYNRSKAVARLLINGNSLCTGFLVSGNSHLLTNNHCIPNATSALNTDYEFMGEAPSCGSFNSQLAFRGNIFRGATFIQTSTSLDFTLVQISSGNPASLYGFLEVDDQTATVNSLIYIPQHAGGKAKQIAIFSTDAADKTNDETNGFCRINQSGNFGICSGGANFNLMYGCDTEGGSSGSPILSRSSHRVVGLHKCGTCPDGNAATSASLIRSQIASFLPPLVIASSAEPPPAPTPANEPLAGPSSTQSPPVTPACLASGAVCTSTSDCCSKSCNIRNRKCK